jgi:hypothetical protein
MTGQNRKVVKFYKSSELEGRKESRASISLGNHALNINVSARAGAPELNQNKATGPVTNNRVMLVSAFG